jgi:pimeloyl-ACP methyl ester carboxylesterase
MFYLKINGIDLWYERTGQGRPVIFLHAYAVTGAMWFAQVPALTAAGWDVVCVDQRGHGKSSAPAGAYTVSQMAADVHQLVERLNLSKVCLVGLSMGGRVAMRFTLDYPDEIAALVLVSSKSEPALEAKDDLEALIKMVEQGQIDWAIGEWYKRPSYHRLAAAAPDLVARFKAEWHGKSGDGFIGAARAIIEMEPMSQRLSEINVPTLALAGELDPLCHPYVELYERSIPHCQANIVHASGHFVNVEQPDHFNNVLLAFLNQTG